jgi:UDP-N-acetylmuramate dehydrogenase
MRVEENRPLASFTTFAIGGPARWFVEATSEDEIVESVEWADRRQVDLFVLGGGSNLLVADSGFDGLVLHIALCGIGVSELPGRPSYRLYTCSAGENWDLFVERAAQANCAGIECMAGIPGTVGGTPVQNVGAYGQEVASSIELVRVFDRLERGFVEFSATECGFAYRRSRFNSTDRGRYIVTRVDYRLEIGGAPALHYADLQRRFADRSLAQPPPSLTEVTATVRQIRRSKGMLLVEGDPDCRSAGSFFKNPIVTEDYARRIAAATAATPPIFPAGSAPENAGRVKLSAAWLIEQAGFAKGHTRDAAAISSRHTLALVNRGAASAGEILALASEIRSAVDARFGVRLEREPVLLGFKELCW